MTVLSMGPQTHQLLPLALRAPLTVSLRRISPVAVTPSAPNVGDPHHGRGSDGRPEAGPPHWPPDSQPEAGPGLPATFQAAPHGRAQHWAVCFPGKFRQWLTQAQVKGRAGRKPRTSESHPALLVPELEEGSWKRSSPGSRVPRQGSCDHISGHLVGCS